LGVYEHDLLVWRPGVRKQQPTTTPLDVLSATVIATS